MAERRSYSPKKDDGKSTILLIGVLLILIVLVGAGLVAILSQRAPEETPPPQDQLPPQDPTDIIDVVEPCDDECMLAEALEAKDPEMCGELSDDYRQVCYEALASDSLDACMEVADTSKKQECLTSFAVAAVDISLCDPLSGTARDRCRAEVDPCADADEYELCTALESGDPSLCGGEAECLVDYSMYKGTTSSCDLIANRVAAAACKSAVLSSDRCYDLGPGSLRDYCYLLFSTYSGNYLTCTQITSDSVYALDCFSLYAADAGNYTLCDQANLGLNNRWLCYTNYSLLTGDKGGCVGIHHLATTSQFNCAFSFAKLHGDPSACNIIGESSSRTTCYTGSILYSNENLDWRNCAAITNFNWRNRCYLEAARLYNDVSICDNIHEASERTTCISAYG